MATRLERLEESLQNYYAKIKETKEKIETEKEALRSKREEAERKLKEAQEKFEKLYGQLDSENNNETQTNELFDN